MIERTEPKKMINKFQSRASADGRHYESTCADMLEMHGFAVNRNGLRIKDCGVQIDIEAINDMGVHLLIECKGGYRRGKKPGGLESSDNVRKAIGSGASLAQSETHTGGKWTPLIIMTPFLSQPHQHIFTQLAVLPTTIIADIISDRDAESIKMWRKMGAYDLQAYICKTGPLGFRLFDNSFWNLSGNATMFFRELQK